MMAWLLLVLLLLAELGPWAVLAAYLWWWRQAEVGRHAG